MKKHDKLWHDINTLLSFLRQSHIKERLDNYYLKIHNNEAPGILVESQMQKLQKWLDEAKNE